MNGDKLRKHAAEAREAIGAMLEAGADKFDRDAPGYIPFVLPKTETQPPSESFLRLRALVDKAMDHQRIHGGEIRVEHDRHKQTLTILVDYEGEPAK